MNNQPTLPPFEAMEWRERFIRLLIRLAAVFGIVSISITFPESVTSNRIIIGLLYVLLVVVTLLPAPFRLKAILLIALTGFVGTSSVLELGPWGNGNFFLLATVVLASLLFDNKTDIALLIFGILFIIAVGIAVQSGVYSLAESAAPFSFSKWAVFLRDFTASGTVLVTAINMMKNAMFEYAHRSQKDYHSLSTERKTIESKILEQTEKLQIHVSQLKSATATARLISEAPDAVSLLNKAVDLIAERFGYYHVGLYILDEPLNTAYMQASSSAAGKSLLGQAYRVDPDRKNPLARAAEIRQAIITTDKDKVRYYADINFPLTRSRLTIPLIARESLIGILDIHADQPNGFASDEVEIMQVIADLTAVSLDNIRLLEETRGLLAQLEKSSSFQTQNTWSKFTLRQKNAYLYTPAGVRPVFKIDRNNLNTDGLHIPIVLQGQTIGRIYLKRKGASTEWSDREKDLIEKIAGQVGLALENSRLVDEAQKSALRNQMIANFSTYVRETLDVESVIRSAASEFRRVFDLKEAEIFIGSTQPDSPTPASNQNSSLS